MNAPFSSKQFDAVAANLQLFALFHMNIAFSSIEEEQHGEVIARCYWPLLHLAEHHGPIGIEASGFTLETIAAHDPRWIETLKRLIASGLVEFIGAGYSQMIGPLVPARVTTANLAIGNEIYRRLLGIKPNIALVNEQAYSGGLVGLYLDAGYYALLMDWDNPSSHHQWPAETRYHPQLAIGADGHTIGLLWTDTVAFQKLQRFAHGDITLSEYLAYIRTHRGEDQRALCIYASDAEIFDFRPGRYKTEEKNSGGEWEKIAEALSQLSREPGCEFVLPSQLLSSKKPKQPLRLETADCPIPVKKQRKYNLSRWAVTGRDDLAINAACESIYRGLVSGNATSTDWKELCYLWASDFRTHITPKRWDAYCDRLETAQERWCPAKPIDAPAPQGDIIDQRYFDVVTPSLTARLDRRRGLALSSVQFGGPALIGTLPHGYFNDIALQADWYTGNSVFEAPGEHKITDLEWCEARLWQEGADTLVFGRVDTAKGPIEKTLRFHGGKSQIDFDLTFHWDDWGKGSLRIGYLTLLPAAFDLDKLFLTTHNGGKECETFCLADTIIDHGAPVSFLVSASDGLAMTEGWVELGDNRNRLRIEVDRGTAPLLGLLTHRRVGGSSFCQFALSAMELDDTSKPTPFRSGPRRMRFSVNASFPATNC
ncbi:MAG: hypothetical protein WCA81_08665 [Rhizomicrobium sp.]